MPQAPSKPEAWKPDPNLEFEAPQHQDPVLVFGEFLSASQKLTLDITATLPGLTARVQLIAAAQIAVDGVMPSLAAALVLQPSQPIRAIGRMPDLGLSIVGRYASQTARPTVGHQSASWQRGGCGLTAWSQHHQSVRASGSGSKSVWDAAKVRQVGVSHLLPDRLAALDWLHLESMHAVRHSSLQASVLHDIGSRLGLRQSAGFDSGQRLNGLLAMRYQDATRIRSDRPLTRWQRALKQHLGQGSAMGRASPVPLLRTLLHQEAMSARAGMSRTTPPDPPLVSPCYTPSKALVLLSLAPARPQLIFACENHISPPASVVVPIRKVYLVINNVSLHRLPDGLPVPVFRLSLSLDASSWAWGFDALLPASAEGLIIPGIGSGPTELVASVNGTPFHVLAESVNRERSFGEASVRVTGRGRNAVLAAPIAPVMTFTNTEGRSARQLMADVLTLNGVPLGWAVDWDLTDWQVPAGAFARQGTWIEALNTIAAAAGGYLLPHPSDKRIGVRHLYPSAPWDWHSRTPDFVLPVDAVARESLRWVEKPGYNRVFVSGQDVGVLGQVTRAGTAGDVLAPMVVDPLITDVAAARQRGIAVLADTGRQVEVSLRLPVLAETGIIQPGAFVEYHDKSEGQMFRRLGLVRSIQVEAGLPEIWQTLGVQSYA